MATDDKQFNEYKRQQEQMMAISKKMQSSLKSIGEGYMDVAKLASNIKFIEGSINKLIDQRAKVEAEIEKITTNIAKAQTSGNKAEEDALNEQLKIQKALIGKHNFAIKNHSQLIGQYKQQANILKSQVNYTNLIVAGVKDIGKGLTYGVKQAKDFSKYFFEQDKAIKRSALSMGVLKDQSKAYWGNITGAALKTTALGVQAADLAKMQANYSDEIGRMVVLSQSGLEAITEIAKGTGLGEEGAVAMAAAMDAFGISVEGTRDKVQQTVDLAHQMGLNSTKVLKTLTTNLKIAQAYNFKKGVEGVTKMAAMAEKFKLSVQDVTGLADKMFSPEGAVDVAAQMQVLGGGFAQMGDAFDLMYKARNDIGGLTEEIVQATKGTSQWNKELGEVTTSGLELHRMKEAAKALGVDYEKLAESSKMLAKYSAVDLEIKTNVSKEGKEFLESTAVWSKKKKQFVIGIDEKSIGSLNAETVKMMMAEKETLASRAKSSQAFDEQWDNIVNTFKTALLPFMKGIFDGLSVTLGKFTNWIQKSGGFEKLASAAKNIGTAIGNFISNNPFTTLLAGLSVWAGLKAATWIANGIALGQGFKMSTGGMFGGVGASSGGGIGASGGGLSSSVPAKGLGGGAAASSVENEASLAGGVGKTSKFGLGKWGTGTKIGAGLALGVGGMALKGIQSNMDDPTSGGAKALGVGGSALEWAGGGAAFGPWGALIGGVLGTIVGAITEFNKEAPKVQAQGTGSRRDEMQDFVSRPGEGAIPFSKKDTLIGMKPGGAIDKITRSSGSGGGSMEINFQPLKIEFGPITLGSGGNSTTIDFKSDPILIRELSRLIQTEIKKAIGGGKLNPNTANG